jgi:glucose-6-phosphate 1-dehydrogenase
MDFRYATSFGKASPFAYERLLLDAMAGDATLFARRDEVENAWHFIDPIEQAWHQAGQPPAMTTYPAGSWGPAEADELMVCHQSPTVEGRLRSIQLTAEAMDLVGV